MVAAVPSLEGSLYLTDPQSIVAYILRRYFRQPADTIPILDDLIISLPLQEARFGREPDQLASNMQSDLQKTYDRIFNNERKITVSVVPERIDDRTYNITISIIWTLLNGDINQTGITIGLINGKLSIPEDTILGFAGLE